MSELLRRIENPVLELLGTTGSFAIGSRVFILHPKPNESCEHCVFFAVKSTGNRCWLSDHDFLESAKNALQISEPLVCRANGFEEISDPQLLQMLLQSTTFDATEK